MNCMAVLGMGVRNRDSYVGEDDDEYWRDSGQD